MRTAWRLPLLMVLVGGLHGCHGCDDDDKGPPPAAPTGIGVNAPSSGRIDITWTDASGNEQGFRIECSTDGTTFTEVGTAPADTTLFTHRGLTPDTPYWYRVQSFNGAGSSAYDGPATTTTLNVAWSATALATGGPERTEHAAIFDPLGPRMIVFGGFDGMIFDATNDVWELSLGVTPAWNLLGTTGGPPNIRENHTAVYDSAGQRMIVFGGADFFGVGLLNDTWALDVTTLTWSQIGTTGPPPARFGHTAIYDAANLRIIVFGGSDGANTLSDVWELDLSGTPTWNQLSTNMAVDREEHVAVYDGGNQRMLMFGGLDSTFTFKDDVWELLLPATGTLDWALISAGTPPTGRIGSAGILDTTDERFCLFSGDDANLPLNTETWFLNPLLAPQWTEAFPTGGAVTGRWGHSAVYDSVGHRMVIFGGDDGLCTTQSDAWGLDF